MKIKCGIYFIPKRMVAHIGKKRSAEFSVKMSKLSKGHQRRLGCPHTEETKKKISQSKTGKKLSPEHAAKVRVTMLGKKHSPEAIAKIVLAKRARDELRKTT